MTKEDFLDFTWFETVKINGDDKPMLFYDYRLNKKLLPPGIFAYEVRHADDNSSVFATIEPRVIVNFAGTILTDTPLEFSSCCNEDDKFLKIDSWKYDDLMTINRYLKRQPRFIGTIDKYAKIAFSLREQCENYLKAAIAAFGAIDFSEADEGIESVSVLYDGGNHPEYASTLNNPVYGINVDDDGDLYLITEESECYGVERLTTVELCEVTKCVYDNLKAGKWFFKKE